MDGLPQDQSTVSLRMLAFNYGYFHSHFYFRFHYLVKRKKRKSVADSVLYSGDHVELSHEAIDFASTVGVGGVVGTQFVLTNLVKKHGRPDLTPQRQEILEKWLHIYNDKMLSRGEHLGGLYDIGFDLPEAHVIRKDQELY